MDCSGKEKTRNFVRCAMAWSRRHGPVFAALVLLTTFLWHCRFVRSGPNLLESNACHSLEKWSGGINADPARATADENGIVLKKRKGEPAFSISRSLGTLEDAEYLAVSMEAAWENVRAHALYRWLQARVVITGYDKNRRFCAPLDHAIWIAQGSRGWHRIQSVVELPPEMVEAVLSVDSLGEEGVVRINHLRVEVVRQRSWFVPATMILLGAWVWAFTRTLLPMIRGSWQRSRAVVIACGILAGIWFFVFPQGRTLFPSFFLPFFLGPEMESRAVPLPTQMPADPVDDGITRVIPKQPIGPNQGPRPRIRTIVPSLKNQEITEIKPDLVSAAPERHSLSTKRKCSSFYQWLRELDGKWYVAQYNLTHFTAFFGIGLFVFAVAGTPRIWPLPWIVAIGAEVIPNKIYQLWDKGDVWDMTSNCIGLLAAMGVVYALQKRWRLKKPIKIDGAMES